MKVLGNSDDYGIVKPTNVLWTETFDNEWLPADWSMESKGASINTWYRDVEYTATVDADSYAPDMASLVEAGMWREAEVGAWHTPA